MARGYCTTRSWSVMRTMEAPRSRTSKKTRAMSTPMGNSQACPEPQARAGSWAASRRAKNDRVKAAAATPRPSSRAVPRTVRRLEGSEDHIRSGTSRSRGQTGVGGSGAGRPSPRPWARPGGAVALGAGPGPPFAEPVAAKLVDGLDQGGPLVGDGAGLGGGGGWLGRGGRRWWPPARQQEHDRVLGQGPGQWPRPVAAMEGEQDDHGGGQGDGEQASPGQAGGGVVVAEDEAGHGQEAADGQGGPQPAADRAGGLEGDGGRGRPAGSSRSAWGGPQPVGGWPQPMREFTSYSFTNGLVGWW